MPLKLNVGVSRKVGLPDYGSMGASCNVEVELDASLLEHDLDGFHARVKKAYVAAHQAVQDELARNRVRNGGDPTGANGPGDQAVAGNNGATSEATARRRSPWGPHPRSSNGHNTPSRPRKPATANQVKAIRAITRRQNADLDGLLRDEYGVAQPEDLTLAEASQLIDQLKAAAEA
jgi:hypothetical protein